MRLLDSGIVNLQMAMRSVLSDSRDKENTELLVNVYNMGIDLVADLQARISALDKEYSDLQLNVRDSLDYVVPIKSMRQNRESRENLKQNLIVANELLGDYVRRIQESFQKIIKAREKRIKEIESKMVHEVMDGTSKPPKHDFLARQQFLKGVYHQENHFDIAQERKNIETLKNVQDMFDMSPYAVKGIKIISKDIEPESN